MQANTFHVCKLCNMTFVNVPTRKGIFFIIECMRIHSSLLADFVLLLQIILMAIFRIIRFLEYSSINQLFTDQLFSR